jgi:peptide methionine sulfoxide reductase msrA/msrB
MITRDKFKWILFCFLILYLPGCSQDQSQNQDQNQNKAQNMKNMEYRKLTPEETSVIVDKGTEAPFTGKYENFYEKGVYMCKRCGAPLFRSNDKFDAHCGWPSFDDAIPGALKRTPDADGMRTEIECAKCGAHLGHVFLGEGFTPKDTRYCVNSISMDFDPVIKADPVKKTDTAIFSGGCFWGVEYFLKKAKGVISAEVGYTGGHKDHPTYQEVCSGTTGHLESIEVVFDPKLTSYEEITRLFFEIHDPTEWNHQGPDEGEQYRSAIFYLNDGQKKTAEKLIRLLKEKGFNVVTEVRKAGKFWKAEDYHQDYYEKNGHTPYCHGYVKRF